jgi:hypothetical protein
LTLLRTIHDGLRRLDEQSAQLVGPLFVAASLIVGIVLCLVFGSWRPLGVIAAPLLGCAVAGSIIKGRTRRGDRS